MMLLKPTQAVTCIKLIPFYRWVLFHDTDELQVFNHYLLSGILVVPVWSHYKWSHYEQFSWTGFHVNLTFHFSGINAAPYGRCMVRFQGTAKLCSRVTVTFSIPTTMYEIKRSSFSSSSPAVDSATIFYFSCSIKSIVYLIMVLVCISLMARDTEYLCMCYLPSISLLCKLSAQFSGPFSKWNIWVLGVVMF